MCRTCACVGFCSCPNGKITILPMILSAIAYTFLLVGVFGCFFIELSGSITIPIGGWRGLGLFVIQENNLLSSDYGQCRALNSIEAELFLDTHLKVARGAGVLAVVMGTYVLIVTFCITCMSTPKSFLIVSGVVALLTAVSSLVTLILFVADFCDVYQCEWGGSAIATTIAAILYLIIACSICAVPGARDRDEPTVPTSRGGNVGAALVPTETKTTVTINETILPDGSTKITKTTVKPDGTRLVEETILPSVIASAPSVQVLPPPVFAEAVAVEKV